MRNPLLLTFQFNLHQLKGGGGGRKKGAGKKVGEGLGEGILIANADETIESHPTLKRDPPQVPIRSGFLPLRFRVNKYKSPQTSPLVNLEKIPSPQHLSCIAKMGDTVRRLI